MMDVGPLLTKLQVRAGMRLWLVDVPPELAAGMSAAPDVRIVEAGEPCDGVIAFAQSPADVASIAKRVLPVLPQDGLLWFAYRKGDAAKRSGLSRDAGWDALSNVDWRPVRSVSIDAAWTGLRFKPVDLVKSDAPDAWRTRGSG